MFGIKCFKTVLSGTQASIAIQQNLLNETLSFTFPSTASSLMPYQYCKNNILNKINEL